MIDYSVYIWKNPVIEDSVEKAYGRNQVRGTLSFDKFVKHIQSHNGVFSRGAIKGVVSDTVSCLKELLLDGYKVKFGELGTFGLSINSEPADSMAEFTANNIKEVNVQFSPGEDFDNLRNDAEFNLVSSRAVQAAAVKAEKNGDTTINLEEIKKPTQNGDGGGADGGGSVPDDDESGSLE